ncbi:ac66 [Malacosoma neustria nucleopolyhedrovirus]|uniref:ac66 n=1 Tax=Malacosoma neustria nuclear polyhedrosis virus TaxID=38012 RepID=UPI000E3592F7|nr:ac66 [Malacosoma neustria nucleopolyhedrovirus]AUF81582.1 ac66 [Malacosoma neustria nucleopolyhedrovirus]
MASNNTRFVYPKYRNTDINQNTVQTLLKTISTMSRRCKAQGNTDDVLDRIRSIIVLHRPHLISSPLQLPELIVEALNPYGPQQITHNFNYKYDYNSNVGGNAVGGTAGGGFDPFGAPAQPPAPYQPPPPPPPGFPQQPTASSSTAPPVQMISYNQIPPSYMYTPNANNNNTAGGSGGNVNGNFNSPPPPPPSSTVTSILPADLSQEEIETLDSLNRKSVDSPNVFNYTELIMYITKISIKYISTNIYTTSLRQVYTMGKNFSNDLTQLISCIRRSTSITLPADLMPLCQIVSQFINAYVSLSGRITNDMVNISDLTSVERVKRLIVYTNEQFNYNWNQNDSVSTAATATNVEIGAQRTANFDAKNREILQLRSTIETELAQKNGDIENLKLSIGKLETNVRLLQSKHDTIQIDNARLATQNEQYKNEIEQSRIAKNDAVEKISKLTLNYDRLKNENEELKNNIQRLNDENNALKLKEQKLSEESASIKETLVTTKGDFEKSSQAVTSLKFSSNVLEQNNNALRMQITELQKENAELKNVSIQLNQQLARYRTETERPPPPLMDVDESEKLLLPNVEEENNDNDNGSYSSFRVKKERQIEQESAILSKKTLESDLEMFQNYIENVTPTNIDLINTIEKLRINLSEIEKERNESLSLTEQLKLERDSKIEIEREVNFLRQNLSKNIKAQADVLDLKINENLTKMETKLLNISTDMDNLNVQIDQVVQFEQDQIVKYETLARSMAADVLQKFYPQEVPM